MVDGNDLERAASSAKAGAKRAADTVEEAHDSVGRHVAPWADKPWFRILARAGFVVTGLVYGLIGWIAIRMALGIAGSDEADQAGALQLVEAVPGGVVMLVIAAVAFFALAAWLLVEGIGGSAGGDDRSERWKYLGTHVAKAVAYGALGVTVFDLLFDDDDDGGSTEDLADDTSDQLMQSPFGTVLLVLAGIAIIGLGIAFIVRGIRRKFEKDLDLSGTASARRGIVAIAVIGYVARGLAFALIGITFIAAVLTRDPSQASGMSNAFSSLTALPFGAPALGVIGVGFIIAGIATVLRAKFQKM